MRGALLLAVLFWTVAVPVRAQAPADSTLRSAEHAARGWLAQLDAAQLERAWPEVAPAMRASTTFDDWAASLTTLRSALPASPRRMLLRAEHSVPLFGGPSVLLSFGVGGGLREVIVVVRQGAQWRIAGYGILR